MEQFKKWLLTDVGQILVGDMRAEAAWRAALKWVLSKSELDNTRDVHGPYYKIHAGIIREELEGGD